MGTCPKCKSKVKVIIGKNECPFCGIFFHVGAMTIELPKIEIIDPPAYIEKDIINNIQKSIAESLGVPKRYLERTQYK